MTLFKRTRPLTTAELTEAAVLADISVLLVVAGYFLPGTGVFWVVSVVPFTALMVRHRFRAVFVGACSGAAIAFLALGPGLALQVGGAGFMGYVCGTSIKRGWGIFRTIALTISTVWTTGAAAGILLLSAFSATRKLGLEQARVQWTGTKRLGDASLRLGDYIVKLTHAQTLRVFAVFVFLPALMGVVLARTKPRPLVLFRSSLLAIYVLTSALLDVLAAAIALLVVAIGFVVSRRVLERQTQRVVVGVWAACALAATGALSVGGKTIFLRTLDAQWPWVQARLTTALDLFKHTGDVAVGWFITHWYIAYPLFLLLPVAGITVITRMIARPMLARIERAMSRPAHVVPPRTGGRPGPVPVRLENVSFTYAGAGRPALDGVSLEIPAASFVGIVGDNGSGKSTLARIFAGAPPTSGHVERPGDAALGHIGGTAVIFQRPESQVLGVRAEEDVLWGLDEGTDVHVDELLSLVGLGGFAARETSTLSGGELQRLAIAAALARQPALLISDESTAMVDPDGRHGIVALFDTLAGRGLTVVHITHRIEEVRDAALIVVLANGKIARTGRPDEVFVS